MTLVDTLDPKRPFAAAMLNKLGAVSDVASYGTAAYIIGDCGLAGIDLSFIDKPVVRMQQADFPNAGRLWRSGQLLWAIAGEMLYVLDIAHGFDAKLLAKMSLPGAPIGIVAIGRTAAVLSAGNLFSFEFGDGHLKLKAELPIKEMNAPALTAHGRLVCVTGRDAGTHMIDLSKPEKPQTVARYRQPFWTAGVTLDLRMGLAYTVRAKAEGIDIHRVQTLRGIGAKHQCD